MVPWMQCFHHVRELDVGGKMSLYALTGTQFTVSREHRYAY